MDPTKWDVPFPVIFAAMFVIVFCRAGATYWVGRLAAAGAHRTRLARLMESPRYLKAIRMVNDYGAPIVAVSFITVGFQTLANLAAGGTQMPLPRYLPALVVGGLAWAGIYSTIGFIGFELIGRLYNYSPGLAIAALVALVGGYVCFIVWRARRPVRD